MSFLESPRGPHRALSAARFASNLGVACVAASVALVCLRALGPIPTQISLDADRVLRERARCEVLFAGPSYVVAQIHPRDFDRKAARLGHPLRSCIFGGTGLRGVELRLHLQRLLAEDWPRLSLVVVDITLGDEPRFDPENWFHPRFIQWHTWESAGWILDHYRAHGWDVGAEQLLGHAKHLGANNVNLGVGIHKASLLGLWPRLQRLFGRNAALPVSPEAIEYADYLATRDEKKKEQARAYAEETSEAKHAQRVAQLIRKKQRVQRRHREREGAWALALRGMVRQHGHEAFFVQAPVWKALPARITQASQTDPLVFFDFNQPAAYPALYEPHHRGRTHHVSWYGGVVYSKLLAIEILKVWGSDR